ncbi:hypothetical protein K474DRAFT_1591584 [Panus rudis PR-1116 ss-1]|nr:hypothetical protein K474DRAFT_1591584 [Panus rudis PR-1116 ss-1]
MPDNHRERSVSGDFDDSDIGSPQDNGNETNGSGQAGKPGRKKNPNSQAARRDQNRIAQREFRLRKQQRIRDLEASVEILSGGKDEAITQLRKIMKDLMQENHVLRGLLRSLSSFIGDGVGGVVPKMGWDVNDFNNFINRSETDTAWESYQRHKRDVQNATAAGSSSQKRASEEEGPSGQAKRARMPNHNGDDTSDYTLLVPTSDAVPPLPAGGLYPPASSSGSSHNSQLYNELLRGPSASPMFVGPASPVGQYSTRTTAPVSGGPGSYQSQYIPPLNTPMNISIDPAIQSMPITTASNAAANASVQAQSPPDAVETDPKNDDAMKLIHYHLDNYKRNSQYCLPSSLRPTLVQRTIPHESVIDSILHPELRDRMILLRGRFDLVDCLHDYRTAVTIHGDDVLAHSNWEINASWLQKYNFLVDKNTLAIVNRWRRERGEAELAASEYSSAEPAV